MDAHYTLHGLSCNPFLQLIERKLFFCRISPQFAFFFIVIRVGFFYLQRFLYL